jgi:outer membrane protein OmpA-like peptidoglycan-associated protein
MPAVATHLTLAAVLVASSLAAAQTTATPSRNFDLVPTKPVADREGGITLESASSAPIGNLALSFALDWNVGILALVFGDQKLANIVPYRIDAHLIAAYQLHPRVELAFDLPAALAQGDNFGLLTQYGISEPGVSGGIGDLRLLPRFIVFPATNSPLGVALVPELRLPTGSGQNLLGGGWLFAPRLVLEKPIGPFRILGNFGARLRQERQLENLLIGNEIVLGLGAIYDLPVFLGLRQLEAMAEMNLAMPASDPFNFSEFADTRKSAWEILVGLRGKLTSHWGAELAFGRGLAVHPGYGREAFRAVAAVRYDFDVAAWRQSSLVDTDGDGVPDSEDECPTVPGPAEFDGCPDTDGDQVPDHVDKCPLEPGPAENAGCPYDGPRVVVEPPWIHLRASVLFNSGSAEIQKQSHPLLDELAGVLKSRADIELVSVEGHTDNRGGHAYNQDLSDRRAKAVVDYLVRKGVERQRLVSRGFGYDRPIASNADALGRAKNRRVEFRIDKMQQPLRAPKAPPTPPAPES